ncbi:XRE family transcriptional regulator [Arthrobacter bambusae]|uniref:Transcriptional regulator with XRE-family HTH domain n=1 Tax=Arthrobacter bambusae TaxID=1338426 RepID=A0AAW8DH83_9MICC|nr:XRE family transcriptional regulator [Arthrobacter bambusae]MDP9904750.1 transcriptional regulator with XRE-family HTH domain [Arthrobacter bambusae]MDQ0180821.1 transcriptional regulator with XRE-family HTH domain [Arthrobacter bambusae]
MNPENDPGQHRTDELPHLAERLDQLFRTVPKSLEDRTFHTSQSVAEALQEQGIVVTANHIRALRSGRRRNPSFVLLAGLAELFHVPLSYFADDKAASEIQESLEVITAMRDAGVKRLLTRAHGVSQEGLGSVLAVLDQIRKIEGIDKDKNEQ